MRGTATRGDGVRYTRDFRYLTPSAGCTHHGCPFSAEGRLDRLMDEVLTHVRDTDHHVRVTETSQVLYGPAETKAALRAWRKHPRGVRNG
jgi:hypothetical protein